MFRDISIFLDENGCCHEYDSLTLDSRIIKILTNQKHVHETIAKREF